MIPKVHVTKTYLPDLQKYTELLRKVWNRNYVTNNGPLAIELEQRLAQYLGESHLAWMSNGTIALQIAIDSLNLTGSILTTPFTYVATANSILWQKCTPIFVDIEESGFSIDPKKLDNMIAPDTTGILAVHVYGYPCDVDALASYADLKGLKLIYDASHTFGCEYRGKALAGYGDLATLSFHATKVFHTIEGGGVVSHHKDLAEKIKLSTTHGHKFDDYSQVGTNGKNSELHAGVGLLNLEGFHNVVLGRKNIFDRYLKAFSHTDLFMLDPSSYRDFKYNYAYAPVLFSSEDELLKVVEELNQQNIYPRRYFYPALNTLPYLNPNSCPRAESVSKRMLCLPLYHDLELESVDTVISVVKKYVLCHA
ncbi:DegT/DnrJ/EryC1/StrS family aminotransferase [Nonlabens marinus]|uniref:DegT/DnrJ/EryC1/StrS family aminotransferase n=1 Tax=Nonlabens marinus TaxID=930802 RepID=UPI0018D4038B|nr:DegT/DnrJ/EryC1/StrS family aminotransferase [Nonlabens marinus]